jgi:hypothetical protein
MLSLGGKRARAGSFYTHGGEAHEERRIHNPESIADTTTNSTSVEGVPKELRTTILSRLGCQTLQQKLAGVCSYFPRSRFLLRDFPAGLLLIFCYVSGTVVGLGGFLLRFSAAFLRPWSPRPNTTETRLAWVDRWQAPLKIILKLNVGFFLHKICWNCYNSTHGCAGKINP